MEKKKKKILIACSCYYPHVKGGGELSTQLLAEALTAQGYEVIIAAVAKEDKVELVRGLKVYRVRHRNLYWTFEKSDYRGLKKILWHLIDSCNFLIARKIISIARAENVDELITSTIEDVSAATWYFAKRAGITTCHILRSYNLLCANATMFKNNHNCTRQCMSCKAITIFKKINSSYVDKLVGISSFILNMHLNNGYFKNSEPAVIHNICGEPDADMITEKVWSPPAEGTIKLGYIGNLLPTKGIETILYALNKIPAFPLELLVAGKGDAAYTESLLQLSGELGVKVTFMGHVKPDNFFPLIDCLIVPSLWNEPFGRIIVEAFLYNVPVIGSDRGGIAELIKPQNGFLYKDEAGLVDKIKFFAAHKMNFDFSDKSKFYPETISSRWTDILQSVDR